MLYLNEDDVRRFLPMGDCIHLMKEAFDQLASGDAVNHPRRRLVLGNKAALHYMAGGTPRYFGAKVYSSHPRHGARFCFLLYRTEDGAPLAYLDANYLGQIRTGAATGFATKLMARPESRTVCIIGSGFQARTQLEAVAAALNIESARVWSRSSEKREAFAKECAAAFNLNVRACDTAEEAVRGADILVTATNSPEPVVDSAWIQPGCHINAVGSNHPRRRELPADLVRRASLIAVDSREQSLMESGDLLLSLEEADWQRVVELQDVAQGRFSRSSSDQITLFKSNGLAVEDVVAAGLVYERAISANAGREAYS
jgi:ornithine cyclodeaminase/alanine dehydrogenase-like protein (mu-crystallin family)